MAVLIDHTNYTTYLKQSTQGRAGSPDGNIFFDTANKTIEFIGVDELGTFDHSGIGGSAGDANQLANFDGITLRALYNFENQERRADETLRTFVKATKGNYRQAGAYSFYNGSKLSIQADRDKVRQSGYVEFADLGGTLVDRIFHGIGSLVDVQATTVPYWTLVTATDEATLQAATWTDFARLGDIDECVQTFGSTSNGDSTAGDFDYLSRTLIIRVRSWGYLAGETDSVATKIAEVSGFTAGYGVGEAIVPANPYAIADVFGGSQVSPWTGMSLVKASAQTETGFNEADGNFTWVLNNTLAGTVQQCAAFLDVLALQDASIDDGAGTYNGKNGRVWYSRNASGLVVTASIGSEGLFIEGLSTSEKQNAIMTDDAAATKTYPFFPSINVDVGTSGSTATNAFYHMFYVDGASVADFDAAGAVTVEDGAGNPIKGDVTTDVTGTIIALDYDYDANTQAGLSAGVDKAVVIMVEGDGDVAQALTFFNITRSAVINVSCAPALDPNA
jgi:hypothetical protein